MPFFQKCCFNSYFYILGWGGRGHRRERGECDGGRPKGSTDPSSGSEDEGGTSTLSTQRTAAKGYDPNRRVSSCPRYFLDLS